MFRARVAKWGYAPMAFLRTTVYVRLITGGGVNLAVLIVVNIPIFIFNMLA